jgi:hypothetical protein
MPEESHLDEMNAAIRAQRERHAVPRSMISTEDARPGSDEQAPSPPAPAPAPAPAKRGLLSRLLGR